MKERHAKAPSLYLAREPEQMKAFRILGGMGCVIASVIDEVIGGTNVSRLSIREHQAGRRQSTDRESMLFSSAYRSASALLRVISIKHRDDAAVGAQSIQIGIGGSLAASPLPHHRTCGSASGGSAG
jgi:hypothetical protein